MKRSISLIIVFALILSLTNSVFATNTEEQISTQPIGEGFYTYATEYSKDAVECALKKYKTVISGTRSAFPEKYQGTTATLYNPVVMHMPFHDEEPMYLFPIESGGKYAEVMMVWLSGDKYICTSGTAYAKELYELRTRKTTTPAYFYRDKNYNMCVLIDDKIEVIFKGFGEVTPLSEVKAAIPKSVKNVNSSLPLGTVSFESGIMEEIELQEEGVTRDVPRQLMLAIDFNEQQATNESWCSAYATACIIRYLRGGTSTPTALSILRMHFSNPTPQNSLNNAQVVSSAQSYGYSPTYIYNTLSMTTVAQEISSRRPIFMTIRQVDSGNNYLNNYHALVLAGYDKINDFYWVWDPYWPDIFQVSMNDKKHRTIFGTEYIWVHTLHNW